MGLIRKNRKLIIINRSFWPIYPVIGEALLRFAEKESETQEVGVILQDHDNIRMHLKKEQRGKNVNFFPCKAWSESGSGIFRRILDAVFFMFWVLGILIIQRPTKIYVSTDPPVVVPFVVMLYSKIFGAEYIYHLQDIHPEATGVIVPLNPILFKLLQWMDGFTMRNAGSLITITKEMAEEIRRRSDTESSIDIIPNPSINFPQNNAKKALGFTFCGNAGRLQRIPLLINAIKCYIDNGGILPFLFAGGGLYANELLELAKKYKNFTYKGVISPDAAAALNSSYQWAILPIEDDVMRYAFPSKSSSYIYSGAYIAAVCGSNTSLSKWVSENGLGLTVSPECQSLVDFFFKVERSEIDCSLFENDRSALKEDLSFDKFLERLKRVVN